MDSFGLEITLILFLILINGAFALSEIAIVSSRKARLQQMANEDDPGAITALELANRPENFLSTVQVGITLIGVLSGAFGGATIAKWFAGYFAGYALLAPYSEALGLTLVVIPITYLSIVVGELVPKRLALNNPEKIARLVAAPMRGLSRAAHPLVVLLSWSTNALLRLLGVKPSTEPAVTEEEIKLMIDQGTQAGTFHAAEQDMIERVFRLADRKVAVLMTPRTNVAWLDLDASEEETRKKIAEHTHSLFPVAQGAVDNIVGVVRGKDLLSRTVEGRPLNIRELCRKPLFVIETTPALKVLEFFKKSGTHIAFVVDEHGSIQGLVTFGDILRSVFEDVEEAGEEKKELVERADGSWLAAGSMPLDEFLDAMEIDNIPEEEKWGMNTLGGFVMAKLGVLPSEGQSFEWKGLKFEVVDMDGRRVDKVLVSRIPERNDAGREA